MVVEAMLPEEFSELEPFAPIWALPTAEDRYQRRLASSFDELKAFYDAIVPRGTEIIEYLNEFDLDDMPEPAQNLLRMMCSLSAVSFAVDIYKQPKIPDSGAAYLSWTYEPVL